MPLHLAKPPRGRIVVVQIRAASGTTPIIGTCPNRVMNTKTQGEHNRSAFGRIATDPLLGAIRNQKLQRMAYELALRSAANKPTFDDSNDPHFPGRDSRDSSGVSTVSVRY